MEKVRLDSPIYKVRKGEKIEDFVADKDGYVWFDETGMLGLEYVFPSEKAAYTSLKHYVEAFLR